MRNGLEARVQEIDHTIFLDPEITPVVVGERDIKQNGDMRATAKVDSYQGYSRLEHGRNWIEAMQHAAAAHGLATRYEFKTLSRSKHLFRQKADEP